MGIDWRQEGDNYYKRNREHLTLEQDNVLKIMGLYNIIPNTVIEAGCSNGYRLNAIAERFGSRCIGLEISNAACSEGHALYPKISLYCSSLQDGNIGLTADLVICNYVLHWVARKDLMKAVCNLDAMTDDGGFLIIGDFGTANKLDRPYKHADGGRTYKQDYARIFTESGLYTEIARLHYNHDNRTYNGDHTVDNQGSTVLLRKVPQYTEVA
jgi:SAM-dependent methyltransferase